MYTLNKAAPRMDPCGTPRVDLRILDISEPFRIAGDHACSSLNGHFSTERETPNELNLAKCLA